MQCERCQITTAQLQGHERPSTGEIKFNATFPCVFDWRGKRHLCTLACLTGLPTPLVLTAAHWPENTHILVWECALFFIVFDQSTKSLISLYLRQMCALRSWERSLDKINHASLVFCAFEKPRHYWGEHSSKCRTIFDLCLHPYPIPLHFHLWIVLQKVSID